MIFFVKLLITTAFISLIGYTETVEIISDITAEDVLELDPDADIFQYTDIIYRNDILIAEVDGEYLYSLAILEG